MTPYRYINISFLVIPCSVYWYKWRVGIHVIFYKNDKLKTSFTTYQPVWGGMGTYIFIVKYTTGKNVFLHSENWAKNPWLSENDRNKSHHSREISLYFESMLFNDCNCKNISFINIYWEDFITNYLEPMKNITFLWFFLN